MNENGTVQTPGPKLTQWCSRPVRYELIDKNGRSHGTFPDLGTLAAVAKMYWPEQSQDEDRTGQGWDIRVVGS